VQLCDLARGVARFPVSAFHQRNLVGMVLRRIETGFPTIEELGCRYHQGAGDDQARADHLRRRHRHRQVDLAGSDDRLSQPELAGHIITIEDPIEFLHQHRAASSPSARSASTPTPSRSR
jgi:twitching motility protein PilU